ncbi:MAG: pyridoxal phosphate-dependent aminotransferase [Myxococcales bacterium]|nr:pyridoxal phosphate-dependent aminotransferase [Myxococcales bacterium]
MFSRRTSWDSTPGALAQAIARARADDTGAPLLDLTCSNPTAVGLHPDPNEIRAALDRAYDPRYTPDPLGSLRAREAVLDYYRRRHALTPDLTPARVCLCAGTSEAYANLLAVLCDPGDVVLVPRPGYPLLAYLADLQGVTLAPYAIELEHGAWRLDLESVREQLARPRERARVRAVIVVAPNNPTGNYVDDLELAALERLCHERELALIIDEVFHDYPLDPIAARRGRALAGARRCLCFTLSGLSKVAALPQLKLSWLVAHGPPELATAAMGRLELIADSFLSVASPVQRALPELLERAPATQARVLARTRDNHAHLRTRCRLAESAVTPLAVEGGWTALVRLPAIGGLDDAGWVLDLLEHARVLTQPGYLYDLDDGGGARPMLALSLLSEPRQFRDGLTRLLARVAARVAAVVASGP